MGGFEILDLVIGVIFVFFILSLICATLQEIRARILNLRVLNLERWIKGNFDRDGKELGTRLWKNFIVDGLTQKNKSASYIPKQIFVSALLNEIYFWNDKTKNDTGNENAGEGKSGEEPVDPYDCTSLRDCIKGSALIPSGFKRMLLQFHSESYDNLDHFRAKIEDWFESAMDRNAGTYKKDAQKWVLHFAILVTIALNVDSIKLIKYFYENKDEAKKVADAAEQMIRDPKTAAIINNQYVPAAGDTLTTQVIDSIKANVVEIRKYHEQLVALGLPIGWSNLPDFSNPAYSNGYIFFYWLKTLVGWFITALAVSLGAQFWFDMLNKLVNLRSSGKRPPARTETEESHSRDTNEIILG